MSKSRGNSKQSRTAKPSPVVGLGALHRATATTLNGTALQGWSNPSSSTNEVVYRITDYFDSSGDAAVGVNQYLFNLGWNPLVASTVASDTDYLSRVLRFKLYALPQFSLETGSSAVLIAFSLPTRQIAATAQRTTLLTPTSVSDWVLVGHWEMDKVFSSGEITPAILSSDGQTMALGTCGVLDPDTLGFSAASVQYRVEFEVACTMPLVTSILAAVSVGTNTDAWSDVISDEPTVDTAVLVQPLRMSDRD